MGDETNRLQRGEGDAAMKLKVDGARIRADLAKLAGLTDAAEAAPRTAFGPAQTKTRAWLQELAAEAGLRVRQDAVGNLFLRLDGQNASLPAVATGSHTDAALHGDPYDGMVGVLGGLEALRAIRRAAEQGGRQPLRSIELVMLAAKVPTRFGIECLGSQLLAGTLDADQADALLDEDGRSLREVRHEAGCTGELGEVQQPAGHWSAWVELHMEQSARLQQTGARRGEPARRGLGVVTGIAAPISLRFAVQGEGGPAGATPMPKRRDALCAAAELVLQVENAARRSGSLDTVATVSRLEVYPGVADRIPSRVELVVEIGDIEQERQDRALRQLRAAVGRIQADCGVVIEERVLSEHAVMASTPEVVTLLEACAAECGAEARRLVSRASHDTLYLSRLAPAAMLLVPGTDEMPGQPTTPRGDDSIALGTAVLAEALLRLANAGPGLGGAV